jgi:hypothetical protein
MRAGKRGFLMLLEMVMVVAIIWILYYILMKAYFRKPGSDDKTIKIESEVAVPNIDTSSPKNVEESVRQSLKNIEKQRQSQMDDFMQKNQ